MPIPRSHCCSLGEPQGTTAPLLWQQWRLGSQSHHHSASSARCSGKALHKEICIRDPVPFTFWLYLAGLEKEKISERASRVGGKARGVARGSNSLIWVSASCEHLSGRSWLMWEEGHSFPQPRSVSTGPGSLSYLLPQMLFIAFVFDLVNPGVSCVRGEEFSFVLAVGSVWNLWMHCYRIVVPGMNCCRSCSLAIGSRFLAGSSMRSAVCSEHCTVPTLIPGFVLQPADMVLYQLFHLIQDSSLCCTSRLICFCRD